MRSTLTGPASAAILSFISTATAQAIGSTSEYHPSLTTYNCTVAAGCRALNTSVVLDALTHSITANAPWNGTISGNITLPTPHYNHTLASFNNGTLSCNPDTGLISKELCPDPYACAKTCTLDGLTKAQYKANGVTTNGTALTLSHAVNGSYPSPRVYLLDTDGHRYKQVPLLGREISFDIDVSRLPCGMNGAAYLAEMDSHGGADKLNAAGAAYGTGYCDAQCPVLPWINGVANTLGQGSCCPEFDLLEANSHSAAFTSHPCNATGLTRCLGDECGVDGICAEIGIGHNANEVPVSTVTIPGTFGQHTTYSKNQTFYGADGLVDTQKGYTVVTQFIEGCNGELDEIRRFYVQDGQIVKKQVTSHSSKKAIFELGDDLANSELNDTSTYTAAHKYLDLGGTGEMGDALDRGMTLVFSLWWSSSDGMAWLDQNSAGCPSNGTYPEEILKQEAHPTVTFANIRFGEMNSTFTV